MSHFSSPYCHKNEIIQHIASFLPPSAAAFFASTCVCIRLATGTQYLSALRASPTERLALLELLLADTPEDPIHNIPSRLLCTHCLHLVPINVGCGASATPACRETWEISKNHIDSSFSPPFFHTIMAMHRHGHETDELLSRITPTTYTTYDSNTRVATQHRLRYKITDEGSLILRTQANYILPHPDVDGQTYPLSQLFCGHFGGHSSPIDKDVALVQTKLYEGNTWWKSKFWYCLTCQNGRDGRRTQVPRPRHRPLCHLLEGLGQWARRREVGQYSKPGGASSARANKNGSI